jgi:hypothetical protein
MEPSVLHNQTALYLEHDDCLYFALGLAKAASEFKRRAEEAAVEGVEVSAQPSGDTLRIADAEEPDVEVGHGEPNPEEDLILFLLGLLSFSRRYHRVLRGLGLEPEKAPATVPNDFDPMPVRMQIHDLLR